MDKLLNCPFCGQQPRVVEDDSYGNAHIFCVCDLEPGVLGKKADLFVLGLQWNTRAAAQQPRSTGAAVPQEVVDALKFYSDKKTYDERKHSDGQDYHLPLELDEDRGAKARAALAALSHQGGEKAR